MTQVKSSSHSPKCLEHSPYPPCIPSCRMNMEINIMPADYDWKQAAPKVDAATSLGFEQATPSRDGLTIRNGDGEVVFRSDEHGNIIENRSGLGYLNLGVITDPKGLPPIEFGGGSPHVTDGKSFVRNPYLLTNPRACTQHDMAWHWIDQISCAEFEDDLDRSVGFADESDEATKEMRQFRLGQSGTVQVYAHKARRERAHAKLWRTIAFFAIPISTAGAIISFGRVVGAF